MTNKLEELALEAIGLKRRLKDESLTVVKTWAAIGIVLTKARKETGSVEAFKEWCKVEIGMGKTQAYNYIAISKANQRGLDLEEIAKSLLELDMLTINNLTKTVRAGSAKSDAAKKGKAKAAEEELKKGPQQRTEERKQRAKEEYKGATPMAAMVKASEAIDTYIASLRTTEDYDNAITMLEQDIEELKQRKAKIA